MRHQVPAGDVVGVQAGLGGEEVDEVAVVDLAEAPQRLEVPLPVEVEPVVVDAAVEVDGELRDPQQRAVDVDQGGGAVAQRQPAGQAQVSVQPAVEQRAAVDLDGHLPPAGRPHVGTGLDPQVGGVGVGADHPEGRLGAGALRDVPGDDGAAAQHVLAAGLGVPGVGLRDLAESGLFQSGRDGGDHVVRGRSCLDEGSEVVGVGAVEGAR